MPGMTTIGGTIRMRIAAAAITPFCASRTVGAAIAFCVMF